MQRLNETHTGKSANSWFVGGARGSDDHHGYAWRPHRKGNIVDRLSSAIAPGFPEVEGLTESGISGSSGTIRDIGVM